MSLAEKLIMKNKLPILYCFCCLLVSAGIIAQEKSHEEKESIKGMHQFTLIISHSHISEGIDENGEKKWIVMPSWGLDYNYWIGEHWAIGLHTDMIIENFSVEEHEGNEVIERTRPFALVPAVVFKPKEHSSFVLGMGAELAKEGNVALTRIGYEYGWELPKHWELSLSLMYDIKWNTYDTWVFGFGVSKFLGRKDEHK